MNWSQASEPDFLLVFHQYIHVRTSMHSTCIMNAIWIKEEKKHHEQEQEQQQQQQHIDP